MSLILAGLVIAGTSGALVVGRWLARRRGAADELARGEEKNEKNEKETREDAAEARGRAEVEEEVPERKDESEPARAGGGGPETTTKRKRKPAIEGEKVRLEGFICQLGDVVMRITGEEAWLAGGLVFSEEVPVAVLFVAPDAVRDCVVYVRARPRESLFWLEPLDPSAVLVGGEPPSSVEHGGIRFDRARRLPLRPRRIGVGAPEVGDVVIVAEYTSAGAERLIVLKGNAGGARAYRGVELEGASFEVIASGDTTLE